MNYYFGDATSCSVPVNSDQFNKWCTNFIFQRNLQSITLLKQAHSADGVSIISAPEKPVTLFEQTGDYLITNQPNIAIAVLTADCLPIIMRDPINSVVAIIHAGWKGSVAKITQAVLDKFTSEYCSALKNISVLFGPAADICCYEVSQDFRENLVAFDFYEHTLIKRDNKIYFDLKLFNKLFLQKLGILEKNINVQQAVCTICDDNFYSYRRERQNKFRQPTIVWL